MDGYQVPQKPALIQKSKLLIPIVSASQDSSDDVRKVQRREKNRIAAQKSRQRQTQKADTLHLVSAEALGFALQTHGPLDHSFDSACVGTRRWGE